MVESQPYNSVIILGPTACGKTSLAAKLAYKFKGEIISADSRQVYKGMDIGTGKDYDDYIVNNEKIPYHLIDVIEPNEEFNLFVFKDLFSKSLDDIIKRNKLPFLVGGTGLYLDAVIKDYSLARADFNQAEMKKLETLSIEELKEILRSFGTVLHNTTDLTDKERIIKAIIIHNAEKAYTDGFTSQRKVSPLILGINPGREEVKKRITERLKQRLDAGMIEEVQQLLNSGVSFEKLNFFGLEYKFIGQHLAGVLSFNDMFQKLNSAIHNFAKRQMTWFRKIEKEGADITWLEPPYEENAAVILKRHFNRRAE